MLSLKEGSGEYGSIEPIKDGVRLEVKPNFLDNETINIAVIAERIASGVLARFSIKSAYWDVFCANSKHNHFGKHHT